MPAETPPPRFPQNPPSPRGGKTGRKPRLTFYGRALPLALALIAAPAGAAYVVRSLL